MSMLTQQNIIKFVIVATVVATIGGGVSIFLKCKECKCPQCATQVVLKQIVDDNGQVQLVPVQVDVGQPGSNAALYVLMSIGLLGLLAVILQFMQKNLTAVASSDLMQRMRR